QHQWDEVLGGDQRQCSHPKEEHFAEIDFKNHSTGDQALRGWKLVRGIIRFFHLQLILVGEKYSVTRRLRKKRPIKRIPSAQTSTIRQVELARRLIGRQISWKRS